MRLSPFPGFVLNYLLSLTGVAFWQYLLGSIIGVAPSVANLVLIGNAARNVGQGVASGGGGGMATWMPLMFKIVAAVSMIGVTFYVSKAVSKAFDEDNVDLQSRTSDASLSNDCTGIPGDDYLDGSTHNLHTDTTTVAETEKKNCPLHK